MTGKLADREQLPYRFPVLFGFQFHHVVEEEYVQQDH